MRWVALISVVMLASRGLAEEGKGWVADPAVVASLAKKGSKVVYREEDVPPYTIPDPLTCADGTKVTTREQWEQKGRPETLELFRKYVYGRSPVSAHVATEVIATDDKAMEGKATHKTVRITVSDTPGAKAFSFEAHVMVPNGLKGPAPAFLLINNRPVSSADPTRMTKNDFWPAEEIVGRGYAAAVFQTQDVDPDKNGPEARAKGVRAVVSSPGKEGEDAWGTIAAWAWGASRVLDYLQTDPSIDGKRVAVVGHSRGGKTALWAAAEDRRFAMACSNDSGCTGAALNRRVFGETVAIINKGFPYWFCGNFHKYDNKESELPVDQNQLIACIAPRAVCVASADQDLWADPRGEFLSLAHATPVYALYGNPVIGDGEMPALEKPLERGKVHYHVRRGVHNLTAYDWGCYLDFADRVWKEGRHE